MVRCRSYFLIALSLSYLFFSGRAFSEEIQTAVLKNLPAKINQPSPFCNEIQRIDRLDKQPFLSDLDKADRIVISKSRRRLYLLHDHYLMKEYNVAFGFGFLDGAKAQEKDGRTPEGVYKIEAKNPNSKYHLALKISYPNAEDLAFAKKIGVRPGGNIMIHGFPSSEVDGLIPAEISEIHPLVDWTQGCVAVTDQQIEEIYKSVQVGTNVEICPDEHPDVQ